jgi:lysophospholipase L1-like esterase
VSPRVPTALAAAAAGALALLGGVSLALAGRHASDAPVLLGWSWRYLLGVMLPLAALVAGQVLVTWRFTAFAAAADGGLHRALAALALGTAVAWATQVPGQPAALLAWTWTTSLAAVAWAVVRRSGEALLAITSLALATSGLLAPEWSTDRREPGREAARGQDRGTFAFRFPREEPLIGAGGRLQPSLRTWLARSAVDAERRVWFATNRIGLRNDEEADAPLHRGGLTVLNLGDSFGIGFGVDQQHFLGPLLQRRLATALRRPVRVWNAEVSDPCYGALYLQRYGASLRPDVVVFGLSGNDLLQGWLGCGPQGVIRLDADGRLRKVERPPPRVQYEQWRQWSYPRAGDPSVVATAAPPREPHPAIRAVASLRAVRALQPAPGPERSDPFRGELTVSGGALVQRGPHKLLFDGFPNLGFAYREDLPPAADSWAASLPLLAAMNRTAQERGARFVLVYLPQRHAVQAQDWAVLARRWNLAASDFDLDQERHRSRAFCLEERITWVDPTDAFRDAARIRNLYLPWDGHFNEAGQALAAQVVAEALQYELGQPVSSR